MVGDKAIAPSCVGFTGSHAMSLGAQQRAGVGWVPDPAAVSFHQSPALIWSTVQHELGLSCVLCQDRVLGIDAVGAEPGFGFSCKRF